MPRLVRQLWPAGQLKAGGVCQARLALVILPPTTLWLITPALPLFSASIVHPFSCNGTPFSCNGTSSSSAFLPPISYIYRGPSALQNKQSSYTAYPVQQLCTELCTSLCQVYPLYSHLVPFLTLHTSQRTPIGNNSNQYNQSINQSNQSEPLIKLTFPPNQIRHPNITIDRYRQVDIGRHRQAGPDR